jgi:hypothetical protein
MELTIEEVKTRATDEQLKSYLRLVERHGQLPKLKMWDGVLFCEFTFILIGIEKDGYAHS